MKISSTFKNIMAFIGLSSATGDVEVTQEQLQQIDTAIPELQATKQKVTDLETAAAADKTKIEGLEAKVTELTNANAALTTKNTELAAEVERLGNQDGADVTTPKSKGDKFNEDVTDPATMSFQQELMSKL